MSVVCVGGGPAGLYFSILMRKAFPKLQVAVLERNRSDDTFGWGVVFSDETLAHFETADAESYRAIRDHFAYWGDIETWFGGECVRSTGHGFCGIARKKLLEILHERARQVGVELVFQREVRSLDELADARLIVACDGVNSALREQHKQHFRPRIHWGSCRFSWLGTTKQLPAFTFVFRENQHGLFQVHAYPFQRGFSTFIVECHEDTWKRAGLDRASEAETVAYCQELFADHLDGHPLISNRSIWRSFPTVQCESWRHENVVLLGDAAHTAHFSIGSGTKLAMEDSIELARTFVELGLDDVGSALALYEQRRKPDVIRVQKAAQTSREWFENSRRYQRQHPLQFQFNLMTRSKRITYDNLARRDEKLVGDVRDWFAREADVAPAADGAYPPPMFTPFRARELELGNRVVVSPMCQYSAVEGVVGDWHLVHLGSRAVGGAGLVIAEMTDVSPAGRITRGCAGLWNDEHAAAWKRIVDFVHANSSARIGVQLAHAGRKGSCNLPWEGNDPLRDGRAWTTLAPSPLPFDAGWPAPKEMDERDMREVHDAFVASTELADRAGFDWLELHMAHGYLLSSFLSPKSNQRADAFGGSLGNRMRYPLIVFASVRAAWPSRKPISVRISATDWLDDAGGFTADDSVVLARALKELGCDVIDVSTGGNTPESKPEYGRMYQVPFAERIRHEVGIPVITVGGVQGADHVNTVIAAGRADLCALARPHLIQPYETLAASVRYGWLRHAWPKQYLPARPTPRSAE